jgi:hypothetical protein
VAGLPDEEWGQIVAAYVVPQTSRHIDETSLIAYTKSLIASHKSPARVFSIPELPRTELGKIKRKELAIAYRPAADQGHPHCDERSESMTDTPETKVGKRYKCATCGAQFLIVRPGKLPSCCGAALIPR